MRTIISSCLILIISSARLAAITPLVTQIQVTMPTPTRIQYSIVHPVTGATVQASRDASPSTINTVINNNGVVAWLETRDLGAGRFTHAVSMAMWSPVGGWELHTQQATPGGFGQRVNELQNRDGVVAWMENIDLSNGRYDHYLRFATCDPVSGWRTGYEIARYEGAFSLGLTNRNGVVAWRDSYQLATLADFEVFYTIYDPIGRNWDTDSWTISSVNPLSVNLPGVSNATVRWTSGAQLMTRGYANRSWRTSPTPAFAYFFPSVTSGPPPLGVYFTDMSIAAPSVNWNFGDGTPASSQRSVYHVFNSSGRFTVTQSVPGSTASTNVTIDGVPPSGSVIVAGGLEVTNNSTVPLALTAADNSGSVASMRFSNDGTAWTAWENFGPNKVWALPAGNGPRTVSVQFRDPVGNVSPSVSDSILLDQISPSGTISINHGQTYARRTVGTLSLTAADNLTAVPFMRFGTNGSNWGGWEPFAADRAWTLIGGVKTNTVFVQFVDGAGNLSPTFSDVIVVNEQAPLALGRLTLLSGNGRQVIVTALPEEQLLIRGTSDFTTWSVLGAVTNIGGQVSFVDPSAALTSRRFYQLVTPPP